MTRNLGGMDRLARIIFGFGLIVAGITYLKDYMICILTIVGLVAIITGFLGRCPLCSIFNINTCNINQT